MTAVADEAPGPEAGLERGSYKIPVFLSHSQPFDDRQRELIRTLCRYLDERGLFGRTLGVTDYDLDSPLRAIRRMMLESNGLITIAFARTHIEQGRTMGKSTVGQLEGDVELSDTWITSPWSHIEPAMAYQLGLPILVLRQKGVIADGVLEKGIVGISTPEFDPDRDGDYLRSPEWSRIVRDWEGKVRAVVEHKGTPPLLY